MSKIAVIGGGFSGLAVCYHLLRMLKKKEVTLFDEDVIGNSASRIASGLLHPYSVRSAGVMWKGKEAFKEASLLIEKAFDALGQEVKKGEGILRLALDQHQERCFPMRAKEDQDLSFWNREKVAGNAKGVGSFSGLFMRLGMTINTKLYLQGLSKMCISLGAKRVKKKVSLEELEDFETLVLAVGGTLFQFEPCLSLNVRRNKGQVLICKIPFDGNFPFSVVGKGYFALDQKEKICYLGSSYEHTFTSKEANLKEAMSHIMPKAKLYLRFPSSLIILNCQAAVRAFCPETYLPLIGRLSKKIWFIGAMGSRGLLYHSYLGRILSYAIAKKSEMTIPKEVRI